MYEYGESFVRSVYCMYIAEKDHFHRIKKDKEYAQNKGEKKSMLKIKEKTKSMLKIK